MGLIELKDIKKVYSNKNHNTFALNGINLTINKGEIIAVMGRSGSGKSTLLNVIGLIDMPNEGEYTLNGKSLTEIRANKVHKTRNEMIGFIFQYFALLKEHTVLDNVVLPLTYRKLKQRERENKAEVLFRKVGLKEHMHKTPDELSGWTTAARRNCKALVGEPELILADEPTGNLDRKTGEEIMNLLLQLNEEGRTIIIVTHDMEVANKCNRIIELVDGEIV